MKKFYNSALVACACALLAGCGKHVHQGYEAKKSLKSVGDLSVAHSTVSRVDAAGRADLHDVHVDGDCSVAGGTTLTRVTIGGTLRCAGSCAARDVRAHSINLAGSADLRQVVSDKGMSVRGDMTIADSTIHGQTNVRGGVLRADNTAFADVVATVDKERDGKPVEFKLTQSTLDSLTIKNGASVSVLGMQVNKPAKRQAWVVLDGTIVHGDIEFKDLQGTVVLRNNAQVTGNVLGGVISKQ